ncbi:DivIVA domain-containing protein [Nocardioides carbamazepini]|uniref:DivIVA domain-containing protein n=1 Tax=Nocardioides carbamazepini TaxID=2854259 RepID=UPI002149D1DB|nr:DivIVA domain-containing protein [Nocardioides carbamazepini]MCR1784764.1 DivIVA domain-containing protein [Nocardioides carbamazepini]
MNRYFPDRHAGLPAFIRAARFKPVRVVHGYHMGDVDALLDRLVEEVEAGRPVRPLIDAAALRTTRWREGYDRSEVDALLAEVTRRTEV